MRYRTVFSCKTSYKHLFAVSPKGIYVMIFTLIKWNKTESKFSPRPRANSFLASLENLTRLFFIQIFLFVVLQNRKTAQFQFSVL